MALRGRCFDDDDPMWRILQSIADGGGGVLSQTVAVQQQATFTSDANHTQAEHHVATVKSIPVHTSAYFKCVF